MAATKVPVIYSLATGCIRQWHVFNGKNETDAMAESVKAPAGMGLLMVTTQQYGDLNKLQALVTQACGKDPKDARYVSVTAQGVVKEVHYGIDQSLGDFVKDCTLEASSTAMPGWLKVNGVLVAPPSTPIDVAANAALVQSIIDQAAAIVTPVADVIP